jgi:hypothetical protein
MPNNPGDINKEVEGFLSGDPCLQSTRITCTVCLIEKELEDFYYRRTRGKHYTYCKECHNVMVNNWRHNNKTKIRELKNRHLSKYNKSKQGLLKNNARRAANKAIKDGFIQKKDRCELCGNKNDYLRADHYKGYKKENWLDIRFICPKCEGLTIRGKFN